MASKVYDIVLDRIVQSIEEQLQAMKEDPTVKFSWVKPWGDSGMPFNDDRGRYYTGINTLLLKRGGAYLTKKVIDERGLKIKKGAKSEIVVFWAPYKKKSEDEEDDSDTSGEDIKDKKSGLIFKYYRVFHESDIEGFERKHHKLGDKPEVSELEDNAISTLESYCEEESIELDVCETREACYYPSLDKIKCPLPEQFKSASEFISTLAHECIHSTGAEKRLNRDIKNSFGDEKYSKEELVAEIGAALLLAMFGIDEESTYQNSIAYVTGWLGKLKEDAKLITYAAQRAQKAAQYILKHGESLYVIESVGSSKKEKNVKTEEVKGF